MNKSLTRPDMCFPATHRIAVCGVVGAFTVLLIVLAARFAVDLDFIIRSISYPFELDYGEGIVWQQALLIPGSRMYGDIRQYPFIVFHYPPVYHLGVRAICSLGVDCLSAGRGLSAFCALAIGALTVAITFSAVRERTSRNSSLICAVSAGLITFTYWPFVVWSPLMRVDMLALALDFLGIICAIRSPRRPWMLYVAIFLFVVAIYTKQTSVAAPLATVPVFLLAMPRQTVKAIGFGLVLGVAIFLLLTWWTDGGFIRHILLYNINRYSVEAAMVAILHLAGYAIYFGLAVTAVVIGLRRVRFEAGNLTGRSFREYLTGSTSAQLTLIFALYLVISTGMLAMLGKSGWAVNYLIEWMCVWSVLIGMLLVPAAEWLPPAAANRSQPAPNVSAVLIPTLLLLQILIVPGPNHRGLRSADEIRRQEQLVQRIRVTDKPVASDDMVLLMKAGKEVPWESAMFTELASLKRWDEQPLVAMIMSRSFAFIITNGQRGERLYDSRHTGAVSDAIEAAYPRTEAAGHLFLHLPPR